MTIRRKLLIAFLFIAVLSSVVTAVLSSFSTRSLFDWYVRSNTEARATQWQRLLAAYYTEQGSWDGVSVLIRAAQFVRGRGMSRQALRQPAMAGPERILLADRTGRIIADSNGTQIGLPLSDITTPSRLPITANGEVVGTVAIVTEFQKGLMTLETAFVQRMTTASIIGGAIVALIGIGLAFIFSRHLSQPLSELAVAARQMASGDFDVKIQVPTGDEMEEVAHAFNFMKDSLKANEEARHKLVADVAHELRTPLSVLRGNLESMQEGIVEPTQETIVSLHDEVLRLSRIVQDLLNLGQMESGGFPLSLQLTNIEEVIARVTSVFAAETDARGISLDTNMQSELPHTQADPDRIAQVLVNLLANAVHHTPDCGRISVSASRTDDNIVVSVTDSGPGIAEEDLTHVFDRFYRTDSARDRAAGGTGLGLSIAKGIITAHKGTIRVESKPGAGTTFTFILPVLPSCQL
ncbi:MAG: HAMP domain-containing protein [Firmicutes bacterium]|jgi:signal transduction histidine kinase|nr:HAMP domain-containing protein [Bacillota bacterium]